MELMLTQVNTKKKFKKKFCNYLQFTFLAILEYLVTHQHVVVFNRKFLCSLHLKKNMVHLRSFTLIFYLRILTSTLNISKVTFSKSNFYSCKEL